jgi:hypothetical protein
MNHYTAGYQKMMVTLKSHFLIDKETEKGVLIIVYRLSMHRDSHYQL